MKKKMRLWKDMQKRSYMKKMWKKLGKFGWENLEEWDEKFEKEFRKNKYRKYLNQRRREKEKGRLDDKSKEKMIDLEEITSDIDVDYDV